MYGTHSWYGDTIGFWDGDKLVTHTKYLLPADFTRWSPMTSNQFEAVETWELKQYPGDVERLEVQVTFYDRHAFVKPVNAVYAFRRGKDLEAAGHRVQHWECETSNNDVFDKGTTTSRLPGEQGFKDARGTTLFPESAGAIARSDLQHHASEREGAEMKTTFRLLTGALSHPRQRQRADGVGRHGPPLVRDVRPERRESCDRHRRSLGVQCPALVALSECQECGRQRDALELRGLGAAVAAHARHHRQ